MNEIGDEAVQREPLDIFVERRERVIRPFVSDGCRAYGVAVICGWLSADESMVSA